MEQEKNFFQYAKAATPPNHPTLAANSRKSLVREPERLFSGHDPLVWTAWRGAEVTEVSRGERVEQGSLRMRAANALSTAEEGGVRRSRTAKIGECPKSLV